MKKLNDGYAKIITDETLRETISHGSEEYPFRYYYEDIWLFDLHCIDWHWHPEVELVLAEKGTADFLVGSSRYVLKAGEAIFINTQVIHRFESSASAIIPNMVFSPLLIAVENSLIYRKYIKPVLLSSVECLIITPTDEKQCEMLDTIRNVFAIQESESISELQTTQLIMKLWGLIFESINQNDNQNTAKTSAQAQAQLQIMMQYIHKNYYRRITLEDIARTVSISKSSVLNIFKSYLHTSPINYVLEYRLKRAAKLLSETENSVSVIAQTAGFENVGYFCRKFKALYGMTPKEYRGQRRSERK
ncbi:MAG: AraC family transcriptional regulator [Firmicutes bacterium]|nr:AraC family transcriptional regulator [Bacillota bacterium]